MPDSLVNEFFNQRDAGEPFRKSLKNAVFQAKSRIGDAQNYEDPEAGPKFQLWKIDMRGLDDDDPVDWWFASTAVPILAAAFGPLANVASIAALVTPWRMSLPIDPAQTDGSRVPQLSGVFIHDPTWCYAVNLVSLILGFLGNLFLLLNFTGRMRFLIALPLSIGFWFISCGFLIGDMAAMHAHASPNFPEEAYTGGFWYAMAAAAIYLMLMIGQVSTLLGYIRGHYPQHFELSDDQQTLIVQTMLYFIWLAGGAGVYSTLEGWHFVDALYWAAVTLLTVGYGDLAPLTTAGRVLLVPYSFIGILILGLVITSIFRSVQEMGEKNIEHKHYEKQRERTVGRTVTSSLELERKEIEIEIARERAMAKQAARPSSRSPATFHQNRTNMEFLLHRKTTFDEMSAESVKGLERRESNLGGIERSSSYGNLGGIERTSSYSNLGGLERSASYSNFGGLERSASSYSNLERRDSLPGTRANSIKSDNKSLMGRQTSRSVSKKERILLLREEKQRFEAMRQIQGKTEAWKRWMRLSIILSIFAVFWLGGACVFWQAEVGASQDLGYGNAVYYSWVTLITIGYGDISPKSVAGRTFFVIWVEFAVPAVTILAQSLTSTVVSTFADSSTMITFALFAKKQTWQNLIDKFPHLFARLPTWLRWKYPDERDLISEKSFEKSSNPVSIKSSENDKGTAAINSRNGPDFNALAEQHNNDLIGQIPDAAALARQLALAIKRAARDMTLTVPRQYGYEEWVEFTRLIRFSAVGGPAEALKEEEDEGLIEWDWLAENSPMMASQNEAEFVLERLCESLVRYLRRNPPRPEFVDRVKEQGEQALRLRSGGFSEEYEPQDVPDPPVSSPRLKKSLMARPSDPTPTTVPATTGNGGGNGDSNSGSGNGGGNGGGNGTSGLGLPPGLRARDLHPVKEEAHDA